MNLTWLNNALQHPKTTITGILVGVLTVAPVFSGQGITFGHAGTGTSLALISGLASAVLGLVAKDPNSTK